MNNQHKNPTISFRISDAERKQIEACILVIRCKKCNSSVIFDEPRDIVYLYRLTEEAPLTYAKLAMKENGLQDYVDAMNEFN